MFWKYFDSLVIKVWKLEVDNDVEYVAARQADDKPVAGPIYDMVAIDGKSAALLGHISLILAVIAILLNKDETGHWFFTLEFAIYATLATILLRCVDILGPPSRPHDPEQTDTFWNMEALVRRTIYQFVLRAVFLMTLTLVIGVVVTQF